MGPRAGAAGPGSAADGGRKTDFGAAIDRRPAGRSLQHRQGHRARQQRGRIYSAYVIQQCRAQGRQQGEPRPSPAENAPPSRGRASASSRKSDATAAVAAQILVERRGTAVASQVLEAEGRQEEELAAQLAHTERVISQLTGRESGLDQYVSQRKPVVAGKYIHRPPNHNLNYR